MASFEKRGRTWRAEIMVRRRRESRTFDTKAEAQAWAAMRETELRTGKLAKAAQGTLGHAFARYATDVSPTKRGARWELVRLSKLRRDRLAEVRLSAIGPEHIAAWRDRRLKEVASATVAREFNLISSVLEIARREWRWLPSNPAREIKRPAGSPPRQRRISADEVQRLTDALGYDGGPPANVSQRVAVAFLLAIETAMRAGELCGLTWADVGSRSVTLPRTKNGDQRSVPLSVRARELIEALRAVRAGDSVLQLNTAQIDALFRKAKATAGVTGLRFHDSRAEACTRLAAKLDVLELARMIGHRDLRSLMVYYRATADQIAEKLG